VEEKRPALFRNTMIVWPKTAAIIGAILLASDVSVHTAAGSYDACRGQVKLYPDGLIRDGASRLDLKPTPERSPLRVAHVRLEPAPAMKTLPFSVLKFDLFNVSSNRLTDVVLEISIVEKPDPDQVLGSRRVLVGPFTVRGSVVLESGYSINYEMLLRNFSSDCSCVANVDVLSVRSLPDSGVVTSAIRNAPAEIRHHS
jgi:hypothetical protein